MVYKRASSEVGATPPKLNLGNLVALRQNALAARLGSRDAPLPIGESLIIAWPQTVALIASTIVLLVAGYIVFQEVRA
jgi:ABC-type transport system involved in multi-copper enzyme maturation permease subunit